MPLIITPFQAEQVQKLVPNCGGIAPTGNREMPISVIVLSTQAPTKAERKRDFLWRVSANLP